MYIGKNANKIKLLISLVLLLGINIYAKNRSGPPGGVGFKTDDNAYITKNNSGNVYISGDSKNIRTYHSPTQDDGKGKPKNGSFNIIEIGLREELKDIYSITNGTHKYEFKDGKIKGLSDGELNSKSTDAVTGRQLYETMGSINAVSALTQIPQVSSERLFSIGVGGAIDHNKRTALALGLSGQDKTRTFIYKLGAGISGQNKFNLGFGFNVNFGQLDDTVRKSDDILKLRIKKLEEIVKKLSENKDDLVNDKLISLENRVEKLENKPVVTNGNTLNELLFVIDNFDFDKATLNDENRSALDKILEKIPKNRKAIIIGHTDTEGDFKYNLKLGLKRAKTVANILRENGIEVIEVKSKGYSEGKENSKENRAVEIFVKY